jgi:CheY-like chemotaxis protein
MDVFLGDRNGLDIIQLIRNEPELQNIKIIMVSGMEKKKECLEAGADAFLLKPYMPDELFTILQENYLKA